MRLTDVELERFMAKIVRTGDCWLWTACLGHNGYGRFKLDGRLGYAHRVAYEHWVGPIPDGLQLDHLCRVRHCVNPAHLEPVTQRENILRGTANAAANAAKTHCSNGHEFTVENTYVRTSRLGTPWRKCRTCARERATSYRVRDVESGSPDDDDYLDRPALGRTHPYGNGAA